MPSLFVHVQRKMTIAAHRRVRSALEGEYTSVFRGRSMDFDDLRAYTPGDDVKDVDWKATARSGQMLIKRYVAVRKFQIMLVVDTGRSMAATAPSGESKRDIAVMVAGVLAAVAQKHGDLIGLAAGDSNFVGHLPLKESKAHIERILQYIYTHTTLDAASSNLANVLDFVKRNTKKRLLLVVISDNVQFAAAEEQLLRRLDAQHELLFIAVDDLDPSDGDWQERELYDVNHPALLPTYVRADPAVDTAFRTYLQTQWQTASHTLDRLRIANVRIQREDEVITKLVRLLERHKHAK